MSVYCIFGPVMIYFYSDFGIFSHVGLLRSRVWTDYSTNVTTTCGVWASAPSPRGWRCLEAQTGSPSHGNLWSMWWTLRTSWWRDSSSFTPMPFCPLRYCLILKSHPQKHFWCSSADSGHFTCYCQIKSFDVFWYRARAVCINNIRF